MPDECIRRDDDSDIWPSAAQNKLNINDWSSVQSLFDKLNKQMEKTLKAADSLGAPRVYIKMLVELEVRFCPGHRNTHTAMIAGQGDHTARQMPQSSPCKPGASQKTGNGCLHGIYEAPPLGF